MYYAYFVTCAGRPHKMIARGKSKEECIENAMLTTWWQYIDYLSMHSENTIEYIFIVDSGKSVVYTSKQEESICIQERL